tara:strand:+ start:184 stop:384 length:201 start_codon:yes stop_codon:yes gene_type:complete
LLSNISYTSLEGVFLLVLMVFFGKAFRENWKMKNTVVSNSWLFKSWVFGLLSSISFFIIILVPMKN